jgi:hypothetical protein
VYYTKFYLYYTHKHFMYTCQLNIGTEHPGSGPYIHSSYVYFMHAFFMKYVN